MMSESNKKQGPYFAGRPLDLDVQLIEAAIGSPARGQVVEYGRIEKITGEKYGSHRFEGILDAWRNRVLESHGIASRRDPGRAVVFMREDERSDEDIKELRFHTRRALKRTADLQRVDRNQLEGPSLQRHDHALAIAAKLEAVAVPAYKSLEPPPAPRRLPMPPIN